MVECGKIERYKVIDGKTKMIVTVENEKIGNYLSRVGVAPVELKLNDPRKITVSQRNKIYALIKDIGVGLGYMLAPNQKEGLAETKNLLKNLFMRDLGQEDFSLSDCSVTIAHAFTDFLVELVIREGVQTSKHIVQLSANTNRTIFCCIKYRKCIITGTPNADVHHCTGSRVGMGGNRKKIDNRGRYFLPVSREWHNRLHTEGESKIFSQYKIQGIQLSNETLRSLGLSIREIQALEENIGGYRDEDR